MFIRNAWYVAATPNEIDDKPLGRTICGERIVFYRPDGGRVAALKPRLRAHTLDVVLANEAVALWLGNRRAPTVYRIHGQPDETKLEQRRIASSADRITTGSIITPSANAPAHAELLTQLKAEL